MKPLMQCQYFAGLWETDLVIQLGWTNRRTGARPTKYRAPSWSWASIDGGYESPYHFYGHGLQYLPLLEILATHVEPVGDDEIGQVKGGYIDVSCQLLPIKLHFQYEALDIPELFIEDTSTPLRFFADATTPIDLGRRLYFMPLALLGMDELLATGLVLHRIEQLGLPDVYQRVGTIEPLEFDPLLRQDPLLDMLGSVNWDDKSNDINNIFVRAEPKMTTIRVV